MYNRHSERDNHASMSQGPELSVIVPTFNRPECLGTCLQALARQQQKPATVFVVNDGGVDVAPIVAGVASELNVELLRTGRCGPTAARNAALAQVATGYVGFLDDDSRPAPDWIAACSGLFQREPEVTAQLGRILWDRPDNATGFRQRFYPEFRQKIFESRHVRYLDPGFRRDLAAALQRDFPAGIPGIATHLSGENSAVRMEFIRRQGAFDTRFRTMSDREMGWRILREGGLVAYNPDMLVAHRHDPSIRRALGRCFLAAPYQKLLASLYPDPPWVAGLAHGRPGGRWKDPLLVELTMAEKLFGLLHGAVQRAALTAPVPLSQDPLVSVRVTARPQ